MASRLLAINIPTYGRFQSFFKLMMRFESELSALSPDSRALIEINVFENCSPYASLKESICDIVRLRTGVLINYQVNPENIGADRNILQACSASPESTFTWVLGDDDMPIQGSVETIVRTLQQDGSRLGLLLLNTLDYKIRDCIKRGSAYQDYTELCRVALSGHPHYLIAHTLISCSIFRTSIFQRQEAEYACHVLMPRLGLRGYFCHMRGIVAGLLRTATARQVQIAEFVSLDLSGRQPSEVDLDGEMTEIYYFYFIWLMSEVGVRIGEIQDDPDMWWLQSRRRHAI